MTVEENKSNKLETKNEMILSLNFNEFLIDTQTRIFYELMSVALTVISFSTIIIEINLMARLYLEFIEFDAIFYHDGIINKPNDYIQNLNDTNRIFDSETDSKNPYLYGTKLSQVLLVTMLVYFVFNFFKLYILLQVC